ncbi:MAG: LON peptidase substrate-binding domain-containing protein [Anaerolineales bacterium]|nr:LON peptidase substrate-binding domain-containing protein [Anaerolineales bacterium]
MIELPLFPLNTVLFPATPIHLHIFEERYKQMIGLCIQNHQPFGVLLIRAGVEAQGPLAEPVQVGCSARIVHVQRLEEGRMNIIAVGVERFRVLSLDKSAHSYLTGQVEEYPLPDPYPEVSAEQAGRLRPKVERLLRILVEMGGGEFDLQPLPGDPVTLAYMGAALLQISPVYKQALLTSGRADEMLTALLDLYRREMTLLEATRSIGDEGRIGAFSRN